MNIIEKIQSLPDDPMAYLVLQAPLHDFEHNGFRADELKALASSLSTAVEALQQGYGRLGLKSVRSPLEQWLLDDFSQALAEIRSLIGKEK